MKTIHGEPSFILETPELSLAVTERAGHHAPIIFNLASGAVSPYSLSPWRPNQYEDKPALLSVLRGDFFCFPFGGQANGPPHGHSANGKWELMSCGDRSLKLVQKAHESGACFEKNFSVESNQYALYIEHKIAGIEGSYNYGSHPILDLSNLREGQGKISTSPFRWASTFCDTFSNPKMGERQSLAENAKFNDLSRVPLATGETADISSYPARMGFDDLVMMVNEPASDAQPFAWSAVVFDSYVWFCLKNVMDFPATLLWFSNGGRSGEPWNDLHKARLGVEEVCSYFCKGVEESREAHLKIEGIPTVRHFNTNDRMSLKLIQAVAPVPPNFDMVSSIVPDGMSHILISSNSGETVKSHINWGFIHAS